MEHVAESPPVEVYNSLFCPQCVQRHITAAAVGVSDDEGFTWIAELLLLGREERVLD